MTERSTRTPSVRPVSRGRASWSSRRRASWKAGAFALLLGISGCSGEDQPGAVASGAAGPQIRVPGLSFAVSPSWKKQEARTSMRLAEYAVSGPAGDASLVLYRFPGGGGSAQQNVERWIGQFHGADGASAKDAAAVKQEQRSGLVLTTLDVRGSYEGQQMPGAPPQPPIQDGRLLALVVEGAGDPYFFKLLGPEATVSQAESAWNELTASVTRAD